MGKNNKEEYKANDLVFGQLRGYPWWPAYIMNKEPSGDYRVVFFGDFTYASLNGKKIRPFLANSRKFDKKNQKLTQAIKSACRVMKKESTIKIETERVLKPVFLQPQVKPKRPSRKKKTIRSEAQVKRASDNRRNKTKKIKKMEAKIKSKRRVSGKNSVQKKKIKKISKPQTLELVNDTNQQIDLNPMGKDSKMSMSLAMDEFKEDFEKGMAQSVRAQKPEKQFLDDLIETKSVKPLGKIPGFGIERLEREIKPELERIFKSKNKQEESAIELLNQTKNSMISLDNMNLLIKQKEMEKTQNRCESILGEGVLQKNLEKNFGNEVIDLNNENGSFSRISKCPSISSKAPFSLKQNDLTFGSSFIQEYGEKANFSKIEKEMQDLVVLMQKTQSVGQLEERLNQWHSELNMKPNFKLIVSTNIGKYISNMRNFCNRRLDDTNHFDNVLQKIKEFEEIIMARITTTFFGQEQKNLIHQIRDQISVAPNQSPVSKDPTIFNQSFPSPHYKPKQEFSLGQSMRNTRRKSTLRQALLESEKHQQPSKRMKTRNSRKYTENTIYFDNLDENSLLRSSINDLDMTGKTFHTDKMQRNISAPIDMNKDILCKMKKEMTQDLEETSVITMKRDNIESKKSHWNLKNLISLDTQSRVGKKFAKKIFQIRNVPQIKCETVKILGKIIEQTLRESSLSVEEYQKEVLRLLEFIGKQGKDFYSKFLSQNQKKCDVHRLKSLLRERMKCN